MSEFENYEEELDGIFELLQTYLDNQKRAKLRELLLTLNEVDIALFLDEVSPSQLAEVFRILPKDIVAEVFAYMSTDRQKRVINSITDSEITELMHDMFIDDAVDFLEEMPANLVSKILSVTDKKSREKINEFLQYPDNTGGSIMTSEYVRFTENIKVSEALNALRTLAPDKETIYNAYIISSDRKLLGRVPLRTILASEDNVALGSIMTSPTVFAVTSDDTEDIVDKMRKYDLISIPVVDKEERLVGIITVDDVMDVMQEQSTKDVHIMSRVVPLEKPYLQTSVFKLSASRIFWLVGLVFAGMISGTTIHGFEDMLEHAGILILFMPMIIATAGNAGSQTAALIITGLSTNELVAKDIWRIIWKEVRVALICAVALGIFNFARIMLFMDVANEAFSEFTLSFIIGLTFIFTITFSKVLGCVLPIFAQKIKIDPAVMASSLLTTVADIGGLLVYFGIATLFM